MTTSTKKIIVNSLSSSRIVGACLLPLIFKTVSIPALCIFLIFLFITDFLDGFLARRWHVQTVGGSLLDPVGDKLLAVMCIFSLIASHKYLLFLLLSECLIAILNSLRFANGDKVNLAIIGKAKTWVLSITLIFASINYFNPTLIVGIFNSFGLKFSNLVITNEIVNTLTFITLGMELATLFMYFTDALKGHKNIKKDKTKKVDLKKLLIRLFDEEMYKKDKDKTFKEIINSME